MAKALIFFAEGFEEVEALTVVDLLRRAKVEVDMVSITKEKTVTGSHNIAIGMDKLIEEVDFASADALILPGGMPGTKNLQACEVLTEQIRKFDEQGKLIAAICAAPMIFGHIGILEGKKACIFPGMEENLVGAEVVYDAVAQAGNVITSRGMGTAIDFGLAIIANLLDQATADELGKKIVYTV